MNSHAEAGAGESQVQGQPGLVTILSQTKQEQLGPKKEGNSDWFCHMEEPEVYCAVWISQKHKEENGVALLRALSPQPHSS